MTKSERITDEELERLEESLQIYAAVFDKCKAHPRELFHGSDLSLELAFASGNAAAVSGEALPKLIAEVKELRMDKVTEHETH